MGEEGCVVVLLLCDTRGRINSLAFSSLRRTIDVGAGARSAKDTFLVTPSDSPLVLSP